MSTDWRSLVTRMADELDHYRQLVTDDRREVHALAMEARAVLARYARPAIKPVPDADLPPRVGHVLRLAEIIREVDGGHDLGAAALAEAILSHAGSMWRPAIEPPPAP